MRSFQYEALEGQDRARQGELQSQERQQPPREQQQQQQQGPRDSDAEEPPPQPPEGPSPLPVPTHLAAFLAAVLAGLFLLAAFLLLQDNTPPQVPPGPHFPAPLQGRCLSKFEPKEAYCSGCPPMHDGKLCASTTRYNDMTKGACGCGEGDPVPATWWTLTKFTAALNCKNLDPEKPLLSWCPRGCGGCFKLCSTGGTTSGKAGTTKAGVCRVFRVTNRCGDGYKEYPEWCSNELTYKECQLDPGHCKKLGSTNKYGYPAHFDLQDYHLQVSDGLGWDNAEVTFEPVSCSVWHGGTRKCNNCQMQESGNYSMG